MKFFRKLRTEQLVLIGFFLFSLVLAFLFGAPWVDLDGKYYQHMAEYIGGHLFKSNWYPVGMALLIRFFWTIGLSVFWIPVLANTLRLWIQFLIFKKFTTTRNALVLVFFSQGLAWMVLGTMLKAESLFVTCVLGVALCLLSSSAKIRLWGAVSFFVASLIFRHAGLFMVPALFFALWMDQSFRLKKLAFPVLLALGGLFLSNSINSGNFLKPSRESFACMHFLAAANTFDYCEKGLAPGLCALDPGFFKLNANNRSANHLNSLCFEKEWAPQVFLEKNGYASVCEEVKRIYSYYLFKEPIVFISEISQRAWSHLGSWESTELGLYIPRRDSPLTLQTKSQVEKLLNFSSGLRFLLRPLMLLGLALAIFSFLKKRSGPASLFLLLAALGHAAGIILNNPFSVMRYQEVTSLLLTSGLFLVLMEWNKKHKRNVDSGKAKNY